MDKQLSYEQVLLRYGSPSLIPYGELLNCVEWQKRRADIISRDWSTCRTCHKIGTDSVFTGNRLIHFYHELDEEAESFDDEGRFRVGARMVLKRTNEPVSIHVHHKYYVLSRKPWEYEDDALETLCSECHATFHQNNRVPVWLDDTSRYMQEHLTPCPRCNGAGHFPEYSHVKAGRCFYCNGSMYIELIK
jgi:hypothetical protein